MKKGFTLFELLVVIAIIGILVSLLIPLVNMAIGHHDAGTMHQVTPQPILTQHSNTTTLEVGQMITIDEQSFVIYKNKGEYGITPVKPEK